MSSERLHNQYVEKQTGTSYPYYDVSGTWSAKFKKTLNIVNPFALEQASSNDRFNFVPFDNAVYSHPKDLPNPVKFSALLPAHYDPLSADEPRINNNLGMKNGPHDSSVMGLTAKVYPRACARYLNIFKRCVMINGTKKCEQEEREFLSTCPNFALEDYRDSKIFQQKARMIQRQDYFQAMEVSSYNKGRTVGEVDGNKRWTDGAVPNLRSDSMWIDDRYVDVTQEEIDAAKARRAPLDLAEEASYAHEKKAHSQHAH